MSFQVVSVRWLRSKPSTHSAAVASRSSPARAGEPDPARAEHAQVVAVGEQGDVAVGGEGAPDHPVGAGADLVRGLAARAAVAPQVPPGSHRADVLGADALELAVLELAQVVVDHRPVGEARQLAGLAGAAQRARQHEREVPALEAAGEREGLLPADVGQRQVGVARVELVAAPFGLTVSREDDLHARHATRSAPGAAATGAGRRPEGRPGGRPRSRGGRRTAGCARTRCPPRRRCPRRRRGAARAA